MLYIYGSIVVDLFIMFLSNLNFISQLFCSVFYCKYVVFCSFFVKNTKVFALSFVFLYLCAQIKTC